MSLTQILVASHGCEKTASVPLFQFKQDMVDPVDLHGAVRIRWGNPAQPFLSTYLTQLDQALLVWGGATAAIFLIAQFYVFSWTLQALIWSALSGVATLISGKLGWFWVTRRQQRWILYTWSFLVLMGLLLTTYGVFAGLPIVLVNLCAIWLVLCAVGYFATGIGIHAPAFLLSGAVHLAVIPALLTFPAWQFFWTGVTMSGCLLCLALLQWQHQ